MKTKNILFLAFYFFYSANFFAQSNFLWARGSTSVSSPGNEGMAVACDANGNVFETGYFGGTSITFGNTTLSTANGSLFLVKYDASGNLLWAINPANAIGFALCADANGNIFVAGTFRSASVTFGITTLTNADNSGNSSDIFLAKYDGAGNVLWTVGAGGIGNEKIGGISTDATGNVFVTGTYESLSVTFGSTTLTGVNGGTGIFTVKYDPSGNVLWAKGASGLGTNIGSAVSTDGGGNALATGYFSSSTIQFGNTTLTNTSTNYSTDIFVVKYDASGNVLWAKSGGGTSNDQSKSISADANGNTFICGEFYSTSISFGNNTLTNSGGYDAFLVKYSSTGNVLWAASVTGSAIDIGYSVSADPAGNAFYAGSFLTGQISLGNSVLNAPPGSTDPMFIAKYSTNGILLCAEALASGGDDQCAIAADPFGNAYFEGDFQPHPFIIGTDTLVHSGNEDIFVAKYNCDNAETIQEIPRENDFSVFPNPSSGIFTVNSKEVFDEIFVYDIYGKIIFQSHLNSFSQKLDLSAQAPGIYFVNAKSKDGIFYSKKIIVE